MIKPGDLVHVWTASDTFRGEVGIVRERGALRDEVWVEIQGLRYLFSGRELVPVEESYSTLTGAE